MTGNGNTSYDIILNVLTVNRYIQYRILVCTEYDCHAIPIIIPSAVNYL